MFSVLLRIMPLLMAVAVVVGVVILERVKRLTPPWEGKSPQRYVFDGVENKLEYMLDKAQIDEWMAQEILQTLINELVASGWDEADAALLHYQGVPFVVQAFENCGIKLVVE